MAEWSEERIDCLTELWADESLSTAEIGRRLGVSKNAIVGKSHRLDLPPRPSPIIRDGPHVPRQAHPRAPRVTLPGVAAAPALPKPAPYKRITTCCFPEGTPGTKSFKFCNLPTIPGKPYCEDCAKRAYLRRDAVA